MSAEPYPACGDELAADLARGMAPQVIAAAEALLNGDKHMPTKTDRAAADRILTAACAEVVRQVRAGETSYIFVMAAAVTAADLLLTPAGGAS